MKRTDFLKTMGALPFGITLNLYNFSNTRPYYTRTVYRCYV